ncbi:MAG: hypothetical protein DRJ30_06620 [Candidatus Methanomethylicota archaeon]|nr:MAG: hypothetical protein DRJ30_06620 [Candidatus Verstraetearchaeota archaeon]
MLSKYVTVSVKIPRKLKEKLERYGIKPSKLLKKAIMEELKRREIQDLEKMRAELNDIIAKFSKEFIVRSIREDREKR